MNNDGGNDDDDGGVCWHGTADELDRLMLALHQDTTCGECAAEPLECCTGVQADRSCVGHSLLGEQYVLDSLLFMFRVHAVRDGEVFRSGSGSWWSSDGLAVT